MNVRKFKSDKNALIAEGNRIVSSSDDAKFIRKENIKVVVTSDPNAFGYTVWDGPSLSDYIACVRQCQRLLHELGFSLIRPQTFPSKGNEENLLRDEFKKHLRARKRSGHNHMLPGRSSFHGRIHGYPRLVSERQLSEGQVISRA